MSRRFIQRLKREPPDVVVATHFFSADVFSACKRAGWLSAPLVVAITDLHPHRFWLSAQADAYICDVEETAREARQRGIMADRLHVLGIPILPAFHAPFDRHEVRRLFQLEPDRVTILVTSGGDTVGPFEAVVSALMSLERALPGRLQLLVVCGQNARMVGRLRRRAQGCAMPMRVEGFIETMPQAMAASDLIVAKAGGMTVSEALARDVPLILYHAIPGQERFNAQYLARLGAAVIARSPEEVAQIARDFVEQPQGFAAMRTIEAQIGRPEAAAAIVSQVIKPLLSCRTNSGPWPAP